MACVQHINESVLPSQRRSSSQASLFKAIAIHIISTITIGSALSGRDIFLLMAEEAKEEKRG